MGDKKSKYEFNSGNILFFFIKKIKIFIIVGFFAFVISGIAAFLITPKFKSTVIVFPTSNASISKSILNTQYGTAKGGDLMNFGEEQEADQLLQVLNSKEIKDLIDKRYHLMDHYGLDSTKMKYARTKYYDWFDANFSFRRTEYVSIIIEVLDTKPELAAAMANGVAAYADTLIDKMQKVRSLKAYLLAKNQYENLLKTIYLTDDSLSTLRRMGVFDMDNMQSKILEKAYYKAITKGQVQISNEIKNKLDLISKFGPVYTRLKNWGDLQRSQQSALYYKYSEVKAEYEQKLPHKYIVESARVSEKKAYPKRLVIMLASSLSAIFFAFVLMLIVESVKKYI